MGEFARGAILGLSGVIGLAIVAVLVSQRSKTTEVVQAGASGFAAIINAAVSPITAGTGGSTASATLSNLGLSNSTGNLLYI